MDTTYSMIALVFWDGWLLFQIARSFLVLVSMLSTSQVSVIQITLSTISTIQYLNIYASRGALSSISFAIEVVPPLNDSYSYIPN